MYYITNIEDNKDIFNILKIKWPYFAKMWGGNKKAHDDYAFAATDWELSVKLVDENTDEIVGAYLLQETKVPRIRGNFYDFSSLEGKSCVEGVSVFIKNDPNIRGRGIGKMLLDYPKERYDFVWGQAHQALGNIDHWKKRRKIFNFRNGIWYSFQYDEELPLTKYGEQFINNTYDRNSIIDSWSKSYRSDKESMQVLVEIDDYYAVAFVDETPNVYWVAVNEAGKEFHSTSYPIVSGSEDENLETLGKFISLFKKEVNAKLTKSKNIG